MCEQGVNVYITRVSTRKKLKCARFYISVVLLWLRIDVITGRKTAVTRIILMIVFLIFLLIFGLKTKPYFKLARYPTQGLISLINMTYLHKYKTTINILVI